MKHEIYSVEQISEEYKISISAVYERAKVLEIFPDFILKRKRFYCEKKKNCIGTFKRYERKDLYVILESRMNNENI
jgi:hypothetical protein